MRSRIPDGTVISGHGYLMFWADGDASRNRPGHPDLHAAFALKRSGDGINLYAPDRVTLIDGVSFGSQVTDVSDGRYPDGGPPYVRLTSPTPGTSNVLSWILVADIPKVTTFVGQTVSFTVAAENHSWPPQSLVYALIVAPPGAILNPTNGLFRWTPPVTPAPSTNTITVRVCASSGAPCRERSFVITALPPPPRFVGITKLSNGSLSLAWQGTTGRSYRAEFKNSLSDPAWTPLGNPEVANPGLSFTDAMPPAAQRFYRLLQLD